MLQVLLRATLLCVVFVAGAPGARGDRASEQPSQQEIEARLSALPRPYLQGDYANGRRAAMRRCATCHTFGAEGGHRAGPNLHGVFGSRAGARTDFAYSRALRGASVTWDAHALDRWIENPRALVPGTRMNMAGVGDSAERADLIAFLAVETAR